MRIKQHFADPPPPPPSSAGLHHPLLFWDCSNIATAPDASKILKIHIFDFDNTIFRSPGPNPNLYNDQSIGVITSNEMLLGGGWWMDPLVLRNSGEGWDKESQKQWEGFWNEDILDLMKLSKDEEDTLSIVLTGRDKKIFTELIMEMLEKREVGYDALVLKTGDFASTMAFKVQVLDDLLGTYKNVEEIVIYDDRKSHLNRFQTFLTDYIKSTNNFKLIYNMVPVFTQPVYLDPKVERTLVEEVVERHNQAIDNGVHGVSALMRKVNLKKSFQYSGFVLSIDSRVKLIRYLTSKFQDKFNEEVLESYKFQIEFIPFSRSLLPKQISSSLNQSPLVEWKVRALGFDEESFAVSMEPVEELKTEGFKNQLPSILPICSKGKSSQRPIDEFFKITNWIPIEDEVKVDTSFGPIVYFKLTPESVSSKRQRKNQPAVTTVN